MYYFQYVCIFLLKINYILVLKTNMFFKHISCFVYNIIWRARQLCMRLKLVYIISVCTYPSNRTSANDRFSDIISLAIKLNWFSLNFSFISDSRSGGICTGLPISPGIPAFGITIGAGRHRFSCFELYWPLLLIENIYAFIYTHEFNIHYMHMIFSRLLRCIYEDICTCYTHSLDVTPQLAPHRNYLSSVRFPPNTHHSSYTNHSNNPNRTSTQPHRPKTTQAKSTESPDKYEYESCFGTFSQTVKSLERLYHNSFNNRFCSDVALQVGSQWRILNQGYAHIHTTLFTRQT